MGAEDNHANLIGYGTLTALAAPNFSDYSAFSGFPEGGGGQVSVRVIQKTSAKGASTH